MTHLTRTDYAKALQVLARMEAQAQDAPSFANALMRGLNDLLACELTTLLVCDLMTGHRQVAGWSDARLGSDEMDNFSQRFFEHSLVRQHGLAYAIVVPLFREGQTLVSVVLNRRCLDFDERDRERLDLLCPHLAFLYRHACQAVAAPKGGTPLLRVSMPLDTPVPGLTQRESEVMHWLACAKTDAEIAALLSISPRTVQKHLEHIYVKLGVETRTAAVMRALAL